LQMKMLLLPKRKSEIKKKKAPDCFQIINHLKADCNCHVVAEYH
jgi:hypothetical protein